MSNDGGPGPEVSSRLGYLLKHAAMQLEQAYVDELGPLGVEARELGVLLLLAGQEPASQQHAARRLGVDRTTMVAVLDTLEGKGLVRRRPAAQDRRRNVVELTEAGLELLPRARQASERAEAALLAPLAAADAQQLRSALQQVVTGRRRG